MAMLLVTGLMILSGCTSSAQGQLEQQALGQEAEHAGLRSLTVYFATCNGYMVPISYPFDDSSGDPIKVATELLLEGPKTEVLFRTIPKGTRLKNCYVSNETVFVDFTSEFNKLVNKKDATKAVKSLCLTLGSIPGVEMVQVLIEGKPIEEIQGIYMNQVLKHSWVNYFGNGDTASKYVVYFADTSGAYMVPVTYGAESSNGIPRKAVERLVAGPQEDSLSAALWPGTRLLDFKIEDGIVYVDFSKKLTAHGGNITGESLFIKSLLLTMGQFSDIKGVQILIEGEIMEYLPEGTQVGVPLTPLREANPFDEVQ